MQTQKILLTVTQPVTVAVLGERLVNYAGGPCGSGERALGVAQYDAPVGDLVAVATHGELLVQAGAAVAVGAQVQSDANGRVVTLAAGVPFGVARDAASVSGDLIRVLV